MSKSTKKWLIAGAFLVVLGGIMFAAVMTTRHWDFSLLSTEQFETNTVEISEDFNNIYLNTETSDILLELSDDNTCRVVCYEDEKMKHSVNVQDGTLTISSVDDKKWYGHIGISLHTPKVTVYLPKADYASIVINAGTGNIDISEKLMVEKADISLSIGDIKVDNMSAGSLDLSASTGEIDISNIACTGDINVNDTTGDVDMINTTCQNLLSRGSTGEITLKNVVATGRFDIERNTGDIVFDGSDASEIYVETDTGNVKGSLLTEKVFVTETSTGNISVPGTTSGGKCEITTSTGDIKITIADGAGK